MAASGASAASTGGTGSGALAASQSGTAPIVVWSDRWLNFSSDGTEFIRMWVRLTPTELHVFYADTDPGHAQPLTALPLRALELEGVAARFQIWVFNADDEFVFRCGEALEYHATLDALQRRIDVAKAECELCPRLQAEIERASARGDRLAAKIADLEATLAAQEANAAGSADARAEAAREREVAAAAQAATAEARATAAAAEERSARATQRATKAEAAEREATAAAKELNAALEAKDAALRQATAAAEQREAEVDEQRRALEAAHAQQKEVREQLAAARAAQLAAATERDDEKERRDAAAADAAELRQRLQRTEARAAENEAEVKRLGDRARALEATLREQEAAAAQQASRADELGAQRALEEQQRRALEARASAGLETATRLREELAEAKAHADMLQRKLVEAEAQRAAAAEEHTRVVKAGRDRSAAEAKALTARAQRAEEALAETTAAVTAQAELAAAANADARATRSAQRETAAALEATRESHAALEAEVKVHNAREAERARRTFAAVATTTEGLGAATATTASGTGTFAQLLRTCPELAASRADSRVDGAAEALEMLSQRLRDASPASLAELGALPAALRRCFDGILADSSIAADVASARAERAAAVRDRAPSLGGAGMGRRGSFGSLKQSPAVMKAVVALDALDALSTRVADAANSADDPDSPFSRGLRIAAAAGYLKALRGHGACATAIATNLEFRDAVLAYLKAEGTAARTIAHAELQAVHHEHRDPSLAAPFAGARNPHHRDGQKPPQALEQSHHGPRKPAALVALSRQLTQDFSELFDFTMRCAGVTGVSDANWRRGVARATADCVSIAQRFGGLGTGTGAAGNGSAGGASPGSPGGLAPDEALRRVDALTAQIRQLCAADASVQHSEAVRELVVAHVNARGAVYCALRRRNRELMHEDAAESIARFGVALKRAGQLLEQSRIPGSKPYAQEFLTGWPIVKQLVDIPRCQVEEDRAFVQLWDAVCQGTAVALSVPSVEALVRSIQQHP